MVHNPVRDLSAHLASAAQRQRMLSPCLFTAPAWNSNPTPRERLECADHIVATARSRPGKLGRRAESPPEPEAGEALCDARDTPETLGSESQPPTAQGTAITKPSRRLPVGIREATVIP